MNLHRRHHFITNYRFRLSSLPPGGPHALLDRATAAGVPSKCDDDHGDYDFVGCGGKGVNRRLNACNVEESHLVLVGWTGRPIGQTDVKAEPCSTGLLLIPKQCRIHYSTLISRNGNVQVFRMTLKSQGFAYIGRKRLLATG